MFLLKNKNYYHPIRYKMDNTMFFVVYVFIMGILVLYWGIFFITFIYSILELFAEIQNENAIIEVKAVNIKFKFRSKNYVFWVFEMPDFNDKTLYLAYMSHHLSKL